VRMFLDEARLAAQLQHPNIAQVYDVGQLGESYFFTMEYVHGETVRALIKRSIATGSATPVACVLAVAAGAAAGLHHAHERKGPSGQLGIVHRDVSPSNLMVTYEGHIKVVDFGVAKAANRASQTHSGTVKGKIAYLSPEQCENREVDRRTDLFALGIVLWELIVGDYLYHRDSDFLAMTAIVNEPPPPPSTLRADIPPELDAFVMRLLAKDPRARYQTASEVVAAVEAIAARAAIAITPSVVARFMLATFGERTEPWVEMNPRKTLTVNSAPIPEGLISVHSPVDDELRRVPTLPPSELDVDELKATLVMTTPAPARPTLPTMAARPSALPSASTSDDLAAVRRSFPRVFALLGVLAFAVGVALVVVFANRKAPIAAPPPARDASIATSMPPAPAIDAGSPDAAYADAGAPADASIAPDDAAIDAGLARPAVHVVPKHVPRHPSADAAVDECASDPMACQQ
ncbi:MAG TPA: serine/threonine-protein kinase, partial [Kofleriaceae bacterium]|nr:serine/threonine-protein kinase [Kofleriaceae bacterium]